MRNWLGIAVVFLAISSRIAQSQVPALDTFTSSDGMFRFVYPQTYDLVIGERMLKATQGKHVGIPVCDFATALACVIYPVETMDETSFEAAGFSVRTVSGVTAESECLAYADQSRPPATRSVLTSIAINDREFRHVSIRKTISGHWQEADLYRTFHRNSCYELQIEVSLSDEPDAAKISKSKSVGAAKADNARESLKLILSSIVFQQ